jgi:hypothetical protein
MEVLSTPKCVQRRRVKGWRNPKASSRSTCADVVVQRVVCDNIAIRVHRYVGLNQYGADGTGFGGPTAITCAVVAIVVIAGNPFSPTCVTLFPNTEPLIR